MKQGKVLLRQPLSVCNFFQPGIVLNQNPTLIPVNDVQAGKGLKSLAYRDTAGVKQIGHVLVAEPDGNFHAGVSLYSVFLHHVNQNLSDALQRGGRRAGKQSPNQQGVFSTENLQDTLIQLGRLLQPGSEGLEGDGIYNGIYNRNLP